MAQRIGWWTGGAERIGWRAQSVTGGAEGRLVAQDVVAPGGALGLATQARLAVQAIGRAGLFGQVSVEHPEPLLWTVVHAVLGACVRCAVKVCVRTIMAWSSVLFSASLWLLASPLPS